MAKKAKGFPELPGSEARRPIINALERCTSGGRMNYQIFDDWLTLVECTLEMLPLHAKSVKQHGHPAEDTPEIKTRWHLAAQHYNPHCLKALSEATALLIQSTQSQDGTIHWADNLGDLFMEWGNPNPHSGQFFTPFHLASLMAQMSSPEDLVYQRLNEAMEKAGLPDFPFTFKKEHPHANYYWLQRLPSEVWEHFQLVSVNDPACGSGVMFIAMASVLPAWMTQFGLVQFFGIDIDERCCKMAKINLLLYGLNGTGLKTALELSAPELASLPEPHAKLYAEAKQATIAADSVRLKEIKVAFTELKSGQFAFQL